MANYTFKKIEIFYRRLTSMLWTIEIDRKREIERERERERERGGGGG